MPKLIFPAMVAVAAFLKPDVASANGAGCNDGNDVCYSIGDTVTSYGQCYTTIYVTDQDSTPVHYKLTVTLDNGVIQVNSSLVYPSRQDQWTYRACTPTAIIEKL